MKHETRNITHKKKNVKKTSLKETVLAKLYLWFPTFIQSVPHHRHIIQKSTKTTVYIVLFGFLIINILSSQMVSSLYFGLVNNNQSAVISYLRLIRQTPEFSSEALKFDTIYNKPLSSMIFHEEKQRNIMIQNLEQLLIFNPYSRDILYALYKENLLAGNRARAENYLHRVQDIDPSITSSKL